MPEKGAETCSIREARFAPWSNIRLLSWRNSLMWTKGHFPTEALSTLQCISFSPGESFSFETTFVLWLKFFFLEWIIWSPSWLTFCGWPSFLHWEFVEASSLMRQDFILCILSVASLLPPWFFSTPKDSFSLFVPGFFWWEPLRFPSCLLCLSWWNQERDPISTHKTSQATSQALLTPRSAFPWSALLPAPLPLVHPQVTLLPQPGPSVELFYPSPPFVL